MAKAASIIRTNGSPPCSSSGRTSRSVLALVFHMTACSLIVVSPSRLCVSHRTCMLHSQQVYDLFCYQAHQQCLQAPRTHHKRIHMRVTVTLVAARLSRSNCTLRSPLLLAWSPS